MDYAGHLGGATDNLLATDKGEVMSWLKRWVKRHWGLYELSELTVGGHCGCCGRWVEKAIVEKG